MLMWELEHYPLNQFCVFFCYVQVPTMESSEGLDQKAVESYLTQLWEEYMGPDRLPALLTRIANNVVFIHEESEDTLQTHC